MKTCPIYGIQYSTPPAISRAGGFEICPVCGAVESMTCFPEEMRAEVFRKIEEQENAQGRVEKRVEAFA